MTYEEKLDAVTSFCDKYEALIDEAKDGTDLYALKELCDAFDEVSIVETSIWRDTTNSLKAHLVNVMLHIAETYANEIELKTPNELRAEMGLPPIEDPSVELFAADPSDGEHWTVAGKPEEDKKSGLCVDCAHCKVPKNMVLNRGWAGYCDTRSKWVSRVSGCTDKFENKEES